MARNAAEVEIVQAPVESPTLRIPSVALENLSPFPRPIDSELHVAGRLDGIHLYRTVAAGSAVVEDLADRVDVIRNGVRLVKGKDFKVCTKKSYMKHGGGMYIRFIKEVLEGDSLHFEVT